MSLSNMKPGSIRLLAQSTRNPSENSATALERPADWKAFGDDISRKLWVLNSEVLVAEARRRTRLENFGDPSIEPALTVLVNSLEHEANLHPLGRLFMRIHLRELLETRLRLNHAWKERAEALEASVIQQPIFITGMPRSGSTFLHELLAEDPENRVPRVWEVMFPLSNGYWPSEKAGVRKAENSLWWFRRLAPGADSVYPMRALTPHECVAIHSYTLLSEEFISTCHIPTYEAFLHTADLGPVYDWQKRFLQHLQMGCSKRRWVLKSPDHIYGIDELLTVFPDALIVQTHRNPIDVVRSSIQLSRLLEGLYARPGDRDQLGIREARKIGEMVGHITRFRAERPEAAEQFIDVKYRELVSDPLAVVQRIYERLDLRLTEQTAERMRRLASNRSRYRRSRLKPDSYRSRTYGEANIHQFQDYCSRFGISCPNSEAR
jgi:Sulfotransferase family